MIIGLLGFEFCSANKGCEALGYSFLNVIKNLKLKQDITIYNFTRYDLGRIPDYYKCFKFEKKNVSFKNISIEYLKNFKKCDYIFDVTMGDSFSDIYSVKLYRKIIVEKFLAGSLSKNYILLPQTYGPFYHNSSNFLANIIFKKAKKIFCRDEISKKVLEESFNIDNAILVSDMAFMLPYDEKMYDFSSNKEKLGINVSGLLYNGGFNAKNQFGLSINYKELIEKIIEKFETKYEIHLIPHVVDLSDNPHDDDYKTCQIIHEEFPNTVLAPAFETPIQAKSYISNMNYFIGSRMHATIAAFSSGVVTIPVSYSRKFEGLFGSLDYRYVINAKKEDTESAYDLIVEYLKKNEELSASQKKALRIIDQKNSIFINSISNIID